MNAVIATLVLGTFQHRQSGQEIILKRIHIPGARVGSEEAARASL